MNKRGSILVFVLAIIVLVSTLSMRLMKETVQELRQVSQFHRRDDLRIHAYCALDMAVGVLHELDQITPGKKLSEVMNLWENPLEYAKIESLDPRVRLSVKVTDDSAKIPLQKLLRNEKLMVKVFARSHASLHGSSLFDEDDGQPYYDALMDWQDADDDVRDEGAEDDYYEAMNPPYFTPGKPIGSFHEFRMVKGFAYDPLLYEYSGLFFDHSGSETQNLRDFRDCVSFHNDGQLNASGALKNRKLLELLFPEKEVSEMLPDDLEDEKGVKKLRALLSNLGIENNEEPSLFRVEVEVNKGKANFRLHAILAKNQGAGAKPPQGAKGLRSRSKKNQALKYPLRILSLRENENLID